MKDLIRRVKDATRNLDAATSEHNAACAALQNASTQFPVGSTITMPDDHERWPGYLAIVLHRSITYTEERGFSWFLKVMVGDSTRMRLIDYAVKPFVEEPA